MVEPKDNSNLPSPEVVGVFSELQKQEFSFLGGQIMQAEGLDLGNREEVEKSAKVVADCMQRGLQASGRTWFRPDESILTAFDLGLTEREAVVRKIKALEEVAHSDRLFTRGEEEQLTHYANITGVFSGDLSTQEDLLTLHNERQRAVRKFQQVLFNESSLAPEAEKMRKQAREQSALDGRATPVEIEDRLFRNLLLNLALYPGSKASISVEVEDVATLASAWTEENALRGGKQRILEGMGNLAQRIGVDLKAIQVYTERNLDDFDFVGKEVDLGTVQASGKFILTTESAREKKQTFLVSRQDEELARRKFTQSLNLYQALEAEASKDDQDFDEEASSRLAGEQYIPIFKSLSPFELAYFLKEIQSQDGRVQYEYMDNLKQYIPSQTYIDALGLVYADSVEFQEDRQEVPGFSGEAISAMRPLIVGRVLDDIQTQRIDLTSIVSNLPDQFLLEMMGGLRLTDQQKNVLLDLSSTQWIKLCELASISYEGYFETENKGSLVFPPENQFLEDYINAMPQDKRVIITNSIRKVISF